MRNNVSSLSPSFVTSVAPKQPNVTTATDLTMCGDNGLKVYHAASALLSPVVVVQTHFWAFRESGTSELHDEEIQYVPDSRIS